jgi:hypothetical protein
MRAEGLNKQRCELPGCNAVVGLDVDSTIYKIVPRIVGGDEVAHVAQFCCREHADVVFSASKATLERTKRRLREGPVALTDSAGAQERPQPPRSRPPRQGEAADWLRPTGEE